MATLRKLGELLPDDTWAVRVAVGTNMLLDDPDVAIYTPLLGRRGRDSTPERAEPGVIAARFRHYESRDGQPLLHDHLVLSVKVRRTDGQWGTLHTRTLLEYTVALSELYNQRLLEEICTDLNLATTPRYPTPGQRPVMERAGIPEDLIGWAATRNEATMRRLGKLVAQYRSRTSQPVTAKIRHRMMARASTDTRPAKKTARPLPVLRARWRDGAIARVGQAVVDHLLDLARTAARSFLTLARPVMDLTAAALDVVATVSVFYPKQFRHRRLLAEARRYLARTFHRQPVQPHTDTAIVATALGMYCRDITPAARGDQQLLPPRTAPSPPHGSSVKRAQELPRASISRPAPKP
ncbi:relaxase domain-containing protein [Streptomyces sp. NPDC057582]|uniref:relaxase domain-containing protein n=1 Tax=Streptomyces sp. NPDC057582 TaxID=3346174 RepID=UPI003695DE4D